MFFFLQIRALYVLHLEVPNIINESANKFVSMDANKISFLKSLRIISDSSAT